MEQGSVTEREDSLAADEKFRLILTEYASWLRRAVRRYCPRDMGIELEDVEQEVAIRLWRAVRQERPIDHLAAYIYKAAATATIDAMRRVRARRETPLRLVGHSEDETIDRLPLAAAPSPERAAQHAQAIERVQQRMERLPDDRRRALGLHLQGFTTHEVADLMGWSEPKARNSIYRDLKSVRHALRVQGIE